jgi:hypothetical protein
MKYSKTLQFVFPHIDIERKNFTPVLGPTSLLYTLNVRCPNINEPIAWPPISSDLTPLDFLCGYMWKNCLGQENLQFATTIKLFTRRSP